MTASTVAQYLAALPADRRAALSAVRKAINENLPDGYEEGMQFGMIGWYVPLSMYPAGYGENPKVPLSFVALASQKSGMVLHFLCFYGHPTLSTIRFSGHGTVASNTITLPATLLRTRRRQRGPSGARSGLILHSRR